jgi:hypothetical protein
MATSAAGGLLARQLKQMQGDKDIPGISCGVADGNIFEWEVMLMINDDCRFYGGETRPFLHLEDLFLIFADNHLIQVDFSAHGSPFRQNTLSFHQR